MAELDKKALVTLQDENGDDLCVFDPWEGSVFIWKYLRLGGTTFVPEEAS